MRRLPASSWRSQSQIARPRVNRIGVANAADAALRERGTTVTVPDETLSFESDIKPLFREGDRRSMLSAFDLWSYADVSTHADKILSSVATGSMPCDTAWPEERVAVFRRWLEAGKPA
jgi:hypothetical protein